jgi:hypothetical protein
MGQQEVFTAIKKGLEYWTLINLTDLSIILSFLALILIIGRRYILEMEGLLSLRVSIELWRLLMEFLVDLSLVVAVIIGFFIINPDIFWDIKVALPFYPAATLCLAVALVLRVFHGGRATDTRVGKVALWLIIAAVIINGFGYTFVMEAAPGDWVAEHPGGFWEFMRSLRSNASLELGMVVFWIFGPLMYAVLIWAIAVGLKQIRGAGDTGIRVTDSDTPE